MHMNELIFPNIIELICEIFDDRTVYVPRQHRPVNNYTVYGPPPPERRPMHQHQSRKGSSDDYLHNHSIFAVSPRSTPQLLHLSTFGLLVCGKF